MVEFRILHGGSKAISRIKTLDLRGLTVPSSRSYWEESHGPGLSKAVGSMSAGRSLNNTSSMHRSNASP